MQFSTEQSGTGQFSDARALTPGMGRTVLLIDPRVEDFRTLVRSIGDGGRPAETVEIHVVDASRDALPQIADILGAGGRVDALHILAHGAPGRVALGRDGLDIATLDRPSPAIDTIRSALSGAELRLIACAAGAGETGRAFVAALSRTFRAAVIASEGWIGGGLDGGADVIAPEGWLPAVPPVIARTDLAAHPSPLVSNFNVQSDAGDTSLNSFGAVWGDINPPEDGDTVLLTGFGGTINLSVTVSITSSAAHFFSANDAVTINDAAGGGITVSSGEFFTWGRSNSTFLPITISANITGDGGVAAVGSGPVTLSGSNDFTGGLSITSGGTISVSGTTAMGRGTTTLDNGTLQITGTTLTANALSVGANGGALTINSLMTMSGAISDGGNGYTLTKTGSGTLGLTGVSADFTGTFKIVQGIVTLNASGATSALANATLDLSDGATLAALSDESIGGLKGSGTADIGGGNLTINQSTDTTYSGVIEGANGFAKIGTGTLTLSGASTYTGTFEGDSGTAVQSGTLNITGSLANTNGLSVGNGGTVSGGGSIGGAINIGDGSQFGRSGTVDGALQVGGDASIGKAGRAATTFHVDVATDGSGGYIYDSMKGGNTFTIADTVLTVVTDGSTSAGDSLTVIDNTGVGAISGTFTDLAEGATLTSGGTTFKISYVGGTGNDVTLTDVTAPSPGSDSGGGNDSTETFTTSQTSTAASGGTTVSTTTLANRGSSAGSAAIVQNTSNNGNLVTATLPASVSLTSQGPATAQSGSEALTTLQDAISARNSTGETALQGGAQTFLTNLGATTTLDIRTIVPSFNSANTSTDPIVITGSSQSGQSEAFVIDMRNVAGKALQLDNIEFASIIGNATVTGGSGDNFAVGDDGNQFISLGEGDDTLYGGDGDDTIGSAAGNDLLFGDAGYDTVNGGSGNDTAWGGADNDVVYGNTDNDVVYGNQFNDTLYGGQNEDTLYGGQDDDIVYGNRGNDLLYGNTGADTLYGGDGADTVNGSEGDDLLYGNLDGDRLSGGTGDDTLFGGAGADTVAVGTGDGIDIIGDFSALDGDRIEIAPDLNGTTIDSLTDLQAAATDFDGNVLFDLGAGNSLILIGVQTADLQSDWFAFT